MSRLKTSLLYAIYVIIAFVAFLYVLFPSEKAKAYIEDRVGNANPMMRVSIDELRPALPMGLKCRNISAVYNDDPLFKLETVGVSLTLGSLFTPGSMYYTFDGNAYQGVMDGRITISETDTALNRQLDLNLKNINLDQIPAVGKLYDIKLSGKLSGKIKFKTTDTGDNTTLLLTVSQGNLGLPPTIPGVEAIDFNQIKSVVTVANRQMNIKNLALTGPQINGTLSGSIQLRQPLGKSRMSLRGKIKPYEEFLADLKEKLPPVGFLSKQPPKGGYTLSITGTLESPNMNIN